MTIAQEIMSQLGNNQFCAMTGARQLVDIGNGIRFRIGRNASKANIVRITLNAMDTYNVEFRHAPAEPNYYKLLQKCVATGKDFQEECKKRTEHKTLQTYTNVYADQLQNIFTSYTGMHTHL